MVKQAHVSLFDPFVNAMSISRLGFILLMLSLVGCTSPGPTRPSYPTDVMKAKQHERKRRKLTGYKRRFKNPK